MTECGCFVETVYDTYFGDPLLSGPIDKIPTRDRIVYCPLHAAARELLDACVFLVDHHMPICDETCTLMGIDQMRFAIAKATKHT